MFTWALPPSFLSFSRDIKRTIILTLVEEREERRGHTWGIEYINTSTNKYHYSAIAALCRFRTATLAFVSNTNK